MACASDTASATTRTIRAITFSPARPISARCTDRYGAPGFLAAYNAGPRRLDDYLAGGTELPNETVNYLASVAPRLGAGTPMSGPLSVYADSGGIGTGAAPVQVAAAPSAPRQFAAALVPAAAASRAGGDGAHRLARRLRGPCPGRPVQVAMEPIVSPGDYAAPAEPAPAPYARPAYVPPAYTPPAPAPRPVMRPPEPAFRLVAVSPPGRFPPSQPPAADWAIQVGAFASPAQARAAAENARALARFLPRTVEAAIGSTGRPDGTVLFRARLKGLSGGAADDACRQLRAYRKGVHGGPAGGPFLSGFFAGTPPQSEPRQPI